MKINELPEEILESRSIMELMGLRVCMAILEDIDTDEEIKHIVIKRINVILESEV